MIAFVRSKILQDGKRPYIKPYLGKNVEPSFFGLIGLRLPWLYTATFDAPQIQKSNSINPKFCVILVAIEEINAIVLLHPFWAIKHHCVYTIVSKKQIMKMQFKILILIVLFSTLNAANAQVFEWAKSFGGPGSDDARAIIADQFGNIYVTGYFEYTADFNPGPGINSLTTMGAIDVYVQKLDSNGNFLWAKSFGGTLNDRGNAIAVDNSGNVYTTGYFEGTVDFNPGAGINNLTSIAGRQDVFIQKLDANGNFIWAKSFGGNTDDVAQSIVIDGSGNIHTTGYFQGTVDFNPNSGTNTLSSKLLSIDIFVQKLDSNGTFLWARSFGGIATDQGKAIVVDASGNVITTGYYGGQGDFDPGSGTSNLFGAGYHDVFVQKMDSNGNFLWAKSFGGAGEDHANSIAVDPSGSVYTLGYFEDSADFNTGSSTFYLSSSGFFDVFLHKLDGAGNFQWANSFGGTTYDEGRAIVVDDSGYVYSTGFFSGNIDFDPGPGSHIISSSGKETFVQKLDQNSNFIWAKAFGESGMWLALDAAYNLYTAGNFFGTKDFDPGSGTSNLTSSGWREAFVQKMSHCTPNTGTNIIIACNSYTWLDGNTYTASNSTATHTLVNISGCDSVVTLNLTINAISDLSTSVNGVTITANNTNAAYQWLDCDNNFAMISGANSQSFTPMVNGNYAVQLAENGCIDTTACVSITTISIVDNVFGNDLVVYPNPTKERFSIDLGKNSYKTLKITISSLDGKIIQSSEYSSNQFLDFKLEEPAGVYLLLIETENASAIVRLVKE